MSMFESPAASGDMWSVKDADGHLVVVEVHSLEKDVPTSLGDKDAISATVHDIDAQATYEDTLIFPKVLVGSLKNRVGAKVLARVGQGVAKVGQKPPWLLFDAAGDEQAVAAATAYLNGRTAATLTSPAPDPAPTAAAPPAGQKVDLAGKTPEQVAALKAMGLA